MDCKCKNTLFDLRMEMEKTDEEIREVKNEKLKNDLVVMLIVKMRNCAAGVQKIECECFSARMINGIYNLLHLEHANRILMKKMLWPSDKKELSRLLPFIKTLAYMTENDAKNLKELKASASQHEKTDSDLEQELTMQFLSFLSVL